MGFSTGRHFCCCTSWSYDNYVITGAEENAQNIILFCSESVHLISSSQLFISLWVIDQISFLSRPQVSSSFFLTVVTVHLLVTQNEDRLLDLTLDSFRSWHKMNLMMTQLIEKLAQCVLNLPVFSQITDWCVNNFRFSKNGETVTTSTSGATCQIKNYPSILHIYEGKTLKTLNWLKAPIVNVRDRNEEQNKKVSFMWNH